MSSGLAGFDLEASPEQARAACRAAIDGLNWGLDEIDDRRLLTREDPARLCCRDSPAEIEIEIDPGAEGRTAVTLAAKVPGFGPVTSRHLQASLRAIEVAIRNRLPSGG